MLHYFLVVATSYCLSGTMADGSYVRFGSVAYNNAPLGTHITIDPPFLGQRKFVVRDRIGYGTQLDLWAPSCGQSIAFGRRTIRMAIGWPKPKPKKKKEIKGKDWRAQKVYYVSRFQWRNSYRRLLLQFE